MPIVMKQTLQVLFDPADIQINGSRPWDIQVHNPDFYARLLAGGSLTLGESYMDGWWDCAALDQFFYRILKYRIDQKARLTPNLVWQGIKATLFNQQSRAKSQVVGQKHYDVGNELYQLMLDKRMNYSCGYWKNA
ncbi:MAG: class I SAM-dependent methyltransferase, partial [Patescibacteria group bacterium]